MANIEHISVDELLIDTAQSRSEESWSNDESDRRLVESIESDGILQPCLVRPVEMTSYGDSVDESYAIIAGSRRYNASVKSGHDTVPCNVIEADDLEAAAKSLKENQERKDLSKNEVANSMQMQYKMLNPVEDVAEANTVNCQDCQYEANDTSALWEHRRKAHPELFPDGAQPLESDVQTDHCAIYWLGLGHYPDLQLYTRREKVKSLLQLSDLPTNFRILLKNVEERTESEKATLERYGIARDRKVCANPGPDGAYRSVVGLYEDLKEIDGLEAESRALRTIGDLDAKETARQLSESVDNVRDRFKTDVADVESAEKKQKAFSDAVGQERERLREISESVDVNTLSGVRFTFDEPKFNRYHARAKNQQKIESDLEMIRRGYEQYLDNLSEKQDW